MEGVLPGTVAIQIGPGAFLFQFGDRVAVPVLLQHLQHVREAGFQLVAPLGPVDDLA